MSKNWSDPSEEADFPQKPYDPSSSVSRENGSRSENSSDQSSPAKKQGSVILRVDPTRSLFTWGNILTFVGMAGFGATTVLTAVWLWGMGTSYHFYGNVEVVGVIATNIVSVFCMGFYIGALYDLKHLTKRVLCEKILGSTISSKDVDRLIKGEGIISEEYGKRVVDIFSELNVPVEYKEGMVLISPQETGERIELSTPEEVRSFTCGLEVGGSQAQSLIKEFIDASR